MTSTDQPDPHETLTAYLVVLLGPAPAGRFLDLRWRTVPATMRRRFLPASTSPAALARVILNMGARSDVYVGVALRDGDTHGGRAAVGAMHVAYVESDSPATIARLVAFPLPASMLIASGTPGHLHIYWHLDDRYPTSEVETVNRRLAARARRRPDLRRRGKDPAPAGHAQPQARPAAPGPDARAAEPTLATRSLLSQRCCARIRVQLPPASVSRGVREPPGDRSLLAIPAVEYVRVLTGRVPNREGKILCPFHDDHDPSLQLYPDGGFYCFGSGCRAGGSIFDFAGRAVGDHAARRRLHRAEPAPDRPLHR